MTSSASRHPITLKRVVLEQDGMASVPVTRDIDYGLTDGGPLTLDVYSPPASLGARPAVVIVAGYPDVGVPRPLGCAFKEMEFVTSLARLIASSGMTAIAYATASPIEDSLAVLEFLAAAGVTYGVDPRRVGLWASSGHVPVALRLLMERRAAVRAAVLSNGFMLDTAALEVTAAAGRYGFVNGCAARTFAELPADVPLFVVRCGRDEFVGVNSTIDAFVANAIARNLPIAFVNHPTAPHAFEINDDTDTSRRLLAGMVTFLRQVLLG